MHRWMTAAGLAALLALAAAAPARAGEVTGARILAYGVAVSDPAAAVGPAVRIVRRTDLIAAITDTNFYIQYVIEGAPAGEPVAVETWVLQYPVGVYDPAQPEAFRRSRQSLRVPLGEPAHAGWGLAEGEYIEPGNWVVQVRHGGRVLAEKMFEIVLP